MLYTFGFNYSFKKDVLDSTLFLILREYQEIMKKLLLALSVMFATFLNAQNIFDAARSGDVKTAKKLFTENPQTINDKDETGYTPLVLAAYHNQEDFVKFLIKSEVELKTLQNTSTALQAASYKGYCSIVKRLLEYGADPNLVDANGTSPLLYAVQFNHPECVEHLMKNGADVYYKDPNGVDALNMAKQFNNSELIELLTVE